MIGRHLARNAVAYLALVVAMSGTAYAAVKIGSAQVVDNSLRSVDLRNGAAVKGADVVNRSLTGGDVKTDSLAGREVRERALGEVPRATLSGRRIDYGKVVASSGSDERVVLAFRGFELRVNCVGAGVIMLLSARSTTPFTSLDWLQHRGPMSDPAVVVQSHGGMWLSTSGAGVGVWHPLPTLFTSAGSRQFLELYLQWSGGTMTVHLMTKMFHNNDGSKTCFAAGSATGGA